MTVEWAQSVFRNNFFWLADSVSIEIPDNVTKAEKLEYVQEKLADGDFGVIDIWRTIGVYLGHTLAHCSDYYDLKHVLVLGRVTLGRDV